MKIVLDTILASIPFPKVNVIKAEVFLDMLVKVN